MSITAVPSDLAGFTRVAVHGLVSEPNVVVTDTLVIDFLDDVTDDDAETAAAAVGYAWVIHGSPTHTGPLADRVIHWPTPRRMIVPCPMAQRRSRNRTVEAASLDFVRDVAAFLWQGSPRRKDHTQLVPPTPGGGVVTIYVR